MTKVKICGITNLEDALSSAKFGADALGFNFYQKSPRYLEPEMARKIIGQLPPEVLKVGVFVNESIENILETSELAGLDAIQLHGDETLQFVSDVGVKTKLEIIKALRVTPDFKPEDAVGYGAHAILLDGYSTRERGGSGETFDWDIAKKVSALVGQLYLAGGLSPENVRVAISEVRPFCVDACSSLESLPGKKDLEKLRLFIAEAKQND